VTEPIYGSGSFWELLERRSQLSPSAVMLRDEKERSLTFAEFHARAERAAAGLRRLGVAAGTPVAWQLPTRIESIVVAFALARLGARQTPLIPIYRHREVAFVLAESGAELFVIPGVWRSFDYRAMAEAVVPALPRAVELLILSDGVPEADPGELPPLGGPSEAVSWVYYTSGTTSQPKGVQHTDRTLLAGAESLAVAWGAGANDVVHMAMPFAHIAGPDVVGAALCHGFPLSIAESFAPEEAVDQCRRQGVTLAGGSTAYYLGFLAEQRKAPAAPVVPTLKALFGGGAPSSPAIFEQVRDEMGVRVLHGYGMTECPMISQGRLGDSEDQLSHSDGHPVRDAAVVSKASDGSQQPVLVDGELCVRGPLVFVGYTDPTLDTFDDDGWFHTGDVGHLRPDGHVVVTGRLKDIIIRKGENVSAKEVEDVIYAHPAVLACAVIGLPDPERGERVCAVVELRDGARPLTLSELHDHCRSAGMMIQKIPEQLEIVAALPRNATLKVLKNVLRDRLGGTSGALAPAGDGAASGDATRE
jgi:acyl-CoA synthetase (AMP-forming)/AMP-acid ligase II